ncbi:phage tail protein, partial [Klebsiella pneumoniae]
MAGNNSDDLIISISTDLATVKRALNRLVSDVGQASSGIEKRFASAGKSINSSLTSSMQERINSMVGIGTSAAKEWNGALADQQKELDRLRS